MAAAQGVSTRVTSGEGPPGSEAGKGEVKTVNSMNGEAMVTDSAKEDDDKRKKLEEDGKKKKEDEEKTKEIKVQDKSRPISSTPVPGTPWYVHISIHKMDFVIGIIFFS